MKRGYTLVETLIYAALFVVLMGAIVNSTLLLSSSYQAIRSVKNTQNAALSAMDQMTRYIRAAESIDGTGTFYNASSSAVMLTSVDEGGDIHTVRFYRSNNRIMMDKDGSVFGPLTQNAVSVNSFVLRPIDTGNSIGVKIELEINGEYFYNTVMLRGSYQ